MSATSAWAVSLPAGMYASTQSRSTPNGLQLVAQLGFTPKGTPALWVQWSPWSSDLYTSPWRGALLGPVIVRLQRYSAPAWSVATQSSPVELNAAVAPLVQFTPWLVERKALAPNRDAW